MSNYCESVAYMNLQPKISIFVPIPLVGGGSIYSNGFFVQTILADRCIHRREMPVVSLKSSSSVKFEIKDFFEFRIFRGFIEV